MLYKFILMVSPLVFVKQRNLIEILIFDLFLRSPEGQSLFIYLLYAFYLKGLLHFFIMWSYKMIDFLLPVGCMVCIGCNNYFRFNHPREAAMLKERCKSSRFSIVPDGVHPGTLLHFFYFYLIYSFIVTDFSPWFHK